MTNECREQTNRRQLTYFRAQQVIGQVEFGEGEWRRMAAVARDTGHLRAGEASGFELAGVGGEMGPVSPNLLPLGHPKVKFYFNPMT